MRKAPFDGLQTSKHSPGFGLSDEGNRFSSRLRRGPPPDSAGSLRRLRKRHAAFPAEARGAAAVQIPAFSLRKSEKLGEILRKSVRDGASRLT